MFGVFDQRKDLPYGVVLTINAPLQPMQRVALFEDPLDQMLRHNGYGVVAGGTTALNPGGDVARTEIELSLVEATDLVLSEIKQKLEALGIPVGSRMRCLAGEFSIEIGVFEGITLYLRECEVGAQFVCDGLNNLLQESGRVFGFKDDLPESVFYLYGSCELSLRRSVLNFLQCHGLRDKARIGVIN